MGNVFEATEKAFSDDFVDRMTDQGASASMAMGNDAAATFNLGLGLSSWLNSLGPGVRHNVVIMGDSNVMHLPAEPFRWAQQLRGDLLTLTGLPQGGEGFRNMLLPEWTRTAGWTRADVSEFGGLDISPDGSGWGTLAGNSAVMTWTLPGGFATHDRFDLYSQDDDFISVQGQYSLNGGAFTATAWDFAPTLGQRLVKQTIVTPITTTLRVRGTGTTFYNFYYGAAFYQGTTGLVVHNLATGGATVKVHAGEPPADRLKILDDLQPALTIVWSGTNEMLNFVGLSQMSLRDFEVYYSTVVERAKQYGDVLMIYPMANNLVNNPLIATPVPRQHADFERVARGIAYDNDCGFISVHALWGEFARHDARGYAADAQHLSEAGHDAVAKFISRSVERVS